MISKEREHLESLKRENESFYQFTAHLDEGARERLETEHKRIQQAHQDVSNREKELFQLFKTEQDDILQKKANKLKDIEDECVQLKADKIYIAECRAQYKQALEMADPDDEAQQEQLMRERIAIETEEERITEDEDKLKKKELDANESATRDLQVLQVTRDQQVEILRKDKEGLKLLEGERREMIDQEIILKNQQFEKVVDKMNEQEKEVEVLEKQKGEYLSGVAEDWLELESKKVKLEESSLQRERSAEEALAQLEFQKDELDKVSHNESENIQEKKKQ